jgi:GTP-binding protein EngB required for normal cell division
MAYGHDRVREVIFAGRSNVGKSTLFSSLFKVEVRRGKKPGTTIKPNTIKAGNVLFTDLPGFGYIYGVERSLNERIKDFVVRYIEENADRIVCAVEVIDAKSFLEIAERWEKRGFIPIEIEMFDFLNEFDFRVMVAANKIDRVDDIQVLDRIVEKLGMDPPWTKWRHVIFPTSAKKGEVENIKKALKAHLSSMGLSEAMKAFRS